jgi:hypothetical protein
MDGLKHMLGLRACATSQASTQIVIIIEKSLSNWTVLFLILTGAACVRLICVWSILL